MNRTALARTARNIYAQAFTALLPIAIAGQWIGGRPTLVIAVSVTAILAAASIFYRLLYRRIVQQLEAERVAAEQEVWATRLVRELNARSADYTRRLSAMQRGERDPGPAALIEKFNARIAP